MPLAALTFLRANPRLILAALALIAALGFVAYERHQGAESVRKADAARLAQARQAIATREVKAQAITDKAASDLSAEHVKIEYRTRTLIQKVPTYVPAAADARCVVNLGFVHLHDAAAAGVPEAAGGPDEAASGVPFSAVAATVTDNYGTAYQWRAEALAWRAWYAEQKAAWDKP